MSSHDEAYLDDYDYYQHTGELSEYFEEEEIREEEEEEPEEQIIERSNMANVKLKHLNELTEVQDSAATKYGVELKSFNFRSTGETLTLYLEMVATSTKRKKSSDLDIITVLYDKDGDIVNTYRNCLYGSSFDGFEVFEQSFFHITPSDIGRVVIYFQRS